MEIEAAAHLRWTPAPVRLGPDCFLQQFNSWFTKQHLEFQLRCLDDEPLSDLRALNRSSRWTARRCWPGTPTTASATERRALGRPPCRSGESGRRRDAWTHTVTATDEHSHVTWSSSFSSSSWADPRLTLETPHLPDGQEQRQPVLNYCHYSQFMSSDVSQCSQKTKSRWRREKGKWGRMKEEKEEGTTKNEEVLEEFRGKKTKRKSRSFHLLTIQQSEPQIFIPDISVYKFYIFVRLHKLNITRDE